MLSLLSCQHWLARLRDGDVRRCRRRVMTHASVFFLSCLLSILTHGSTIIVVAVANIFDTTGPRLLLLVLPTSMTLARVCCHRCLVSIGRRFGVTVISASFVYVRHFWPVFFRVAAVNLDNIGPRLLLLLLPTSLTHWPAFVVIAVFQHRLAHLRDGDVRRFRRRLMACLVALPL